MTAAHVSENQVDMRRVGDIEVDHFVDFRLDDIFSLAMRKSRKGSEPGGESSKLKRFFHESGYSENY